MKLIKSLSLLIILLLFTRCGDPDMNITSSQYEPKIAVEGYLFCGETVKNIRLTRNFALGSYQDMNKLYLTPAENNVVVKINGTALNFDELKKTYFNDQLTVDYGTTYKIEISATIDGKQLTASSTTTTPQKGFSVVNHDLGIIKYRETPLNINFNTSPGTDLYVFSFMADTASIDNFIYDNPYLPNLNKEDILDDFNSFRYEYNLISDIDSYSLKSYLYSVQGYDTWFYSSYTATVYAGDKNFRYYLFTAPNVKESDGNFHEPFQIFEGDGIGVFASAIKETVKFTITK
jgi:hypothetical protein